MKEFKIFKTDNQIKKHVSQMTQEEINFLNKKLDEIKNLTKSRHLLDRKDTGRIPVKIFKDILNNPKRRNIIEYNETTKDGIISRRILVRDSRYVANTKFYQAHEYECKGSASLCFVVDYETGRIITAYYNYKSDNHISLDMSRYDANLECISSNKEMIAA